MLPYLVEDDATLLRTLSRELIVKELTGVRRRKTKKEGIFKRYMA
jgi:hypothetical protein